MVLDPHRWLELRRFRGLFESDVISLSEIASEAGLNRRGDPEVAAGSLSALLSQTAAARVEVGRRPLSV